MPDVKKFSRGARLFKQPIYLQEHDSLIQFRGVRINMDWLPRQGATGTDVNPNDFDEGWQALP
ncbi:MAG TPA: hypothetical protein DIW81_19325 [Planctomycetaceae bacterium]|nr:hypothetical protein [Rubinisphaera sp.]HCS53710.1 hypothetical protein [Planctomycetaceae bacterium]